MANQDASITISIIAKDLASGNIGKAVSGLDALAKKGGLVGSMAQGVGQSFGHMISPVMLASRAIGIAGAAISQVTEFLADGITSAIEEEKSLARLDTALQNNVRSWDGNRDAIDEAIESRMKLAFEDDVLRDSLGKLVAATKNETRALGLQNLAMDVARGRNIDLAAATDLVLKANMGNVGALRRMGIALDKGATKTEILAKLTEMYAGQAEAFAETTEGMALGASIAFDEVSESIGEELLPMLASVAQVTRDDVAPALLAAVEIMKGAFLGEEIDLDNTLIGGLRDFLAGSGPLFSGFVADMDRAMIRAKMFEDQIAAARDREGGLGAPIDINAKSITDGIETQIPFIDKAFDKIAAIAAEGGRDVANNFADALRGNKDKVRDAMDDLKWALAHPMAQARELARIEGALTSANLAEGLAHGEEGVRIISNQIRNGLIADWEALTGRAYNSGVASANALEKGLRTFRAPNFPVFGGGFRDPNRDPGHQGPGGRHAGGPVRANTPYIVGETRAELFVPDQNGTILPSVPSARGGGNVNLSVTIQSYVPPSPSQAQAAAQAILPGLVREMRRQQLLPSH